MSGRDTAPPPRRGWESWQGNNFFFWDGRIIGGPEWFNLLRTSMALTIPTVLFLAGPARKQLNDGNGWVLGISLCTYLFSQCLLLVTAFSDPGIIPRADDNNRKWSQHRPSPPQVQEINVGGRIVQLKWCKTCKIFRPPRSSHCSICDNCVERFDHHCPWIGNCIGLRNYIYFTCYVWSQFAHAVFVLVMASIQFAHGLRDSDESGGWNRFSDSARDNVLALIIMIYAFPFFLFTGSLCGFHSFLVVTQKTTNEHLRGMHSHGSPFSRGCFGNINDICCTLPPETNVHVHHLPPELKPNQQWVGKRVVQYMQPEDMEEYVSSTDAKKAISDANNIA